MSTRVIPNAQWEQFMRDNPVCVVCGTTDSPSVDHIKPRSEGGTDELENLRRLCVPCNASKCDKEEGYFQRYYAHRPDRPSVMESLLTLDRERKGG